MVMNSLGETDQFTVPEDISDPLLTLLGELRLLSSRGGKADARRVCPIDVQTFVKILPYLRTQATLAELLWVNVIISEHAAVGSENKLTMERAVLDLALKRAVTADDRELIHRRMPPDPALRSLEGQIGSGLASF